MSHMNSLLYYNIILLFLNDIKYIVIIVLCLIFVMANNYHICIVILICTQLLFSVYIFNYHWDIIHFMQLHM